MISVACNIFALSFNLGGGVVRMQEIIRAVLTEWAIITRVAPLAESELFRQQLLRVLLRSGPGLQKLVLLPLPNGNILRRCSSPQE